MNFVAIVIACLCATHSFANAEYARKEAAEGEAPYQCSLLLRGEGNTAFTHTCGCVIHNEKWILTNAGCIKGENAEDLKILVGTNDFSNGGRRYNVEKLIPHPEYAYVHSISIWYINNDIGLIRVSGSIEFNTLTQPIELFEGEIPPDSDVKLTGWSDLSSDGGKKQGRLKKMEMMAISKSSCYSKQQTLSPVLIEDSNLCATNKPGQFVNFEREEIGGPLVYDGKLVGLVGYGLRDQIIVFTKVPHFLDWIRDTISKNAKN